MVRSPADVARYMDLLSAKEALRKRDRDTLIGASFDPILELLRSRSKKYALVWASGRGIYCRCQEVESDQQVRDRIVRRLSDC